MMVKRLRDLHLIVLYHFRSSDLLNINLDFPVILIL